jgi:RAP1 GTPase activating protein 1
MLIQTELLAGLDTRSDTTGVHSYHTILEDDINIEVMLHVSTMLPFTKGDKQQVERKRHIGNDIVVIVFNESETPFSPAVMTSDYNSIFHGIDLIILDIYAVVQPIVSQGQTKYRLGFASKHGVPPFGPLLNAPSEFSSGETFRKFLLTKCN